MKSCEWKPQLGIKTEMERIMIKSETPDKLLESILNDEVFGFAKLDIVAPKGKR